MSLIINRRVSFGFLVTRVQALCTLSRSIACSQEALAKNILSFLRSVMVRATLSVYYIGVIYIRHWYAFMHILVYFETDVQEFSLHRLGVFVFS